MISTGVARGVEYEEVNSSYSRLILFLISWKSVWDHRYIVLSLGWDKRAVINDLTNTAS